MTRKRMAELLALKKCLTIVFFGLPDKGHRVSEYRYNHKRWTMDGDRLTCEGMVSGIKQKRPYSRHISKIAMVLKGDQLLYGRRCRNCGGAVAKSHGNCFHCYGERIEEVR